MSNFKKVWRIFLLMWLKVVYGGGSISSLIEFDGIYNIRDKSFPDAFSNKS